MTHWGLIKEWLSFKGSVVKFRRTEYRAFPQCIHESGKVKKVFYFPAHAQTKVSLAILVVFSCCVWDFRPALLLFLEFCVYISFFVVLAIMICCLLCVPDCEVKFGVWAYNSLKTICNWERDRRSFFKPFFLIRSFCTNFFSIIVRDIIVLENFLLSFSQS